MTAQVPRRPTWDEWPAPGGDRPGARYIPSVREYGQSTPAMTAVITSLLEQRDELARLLADHVKMKVEQYRLNPALDDEVHLAACKANVVAVLGLLSNGRSLDTTAPRRAGRERARAGVPLSTVLDAYRVGAGFIWEIVADAAQAAAVPADDLIAVTALLWQGQDLFASAMGEGYREESTTMLLRQQEERAALVEALLTGRLLPEATLWDVADVLRLPSTGPFVVVVAALDVVGRQVLPGVEERLRVADVSSAWRLLPDQQVGIVQVRTASELRRLLAELGGYPLARQGMSPTFESLAEAAPALRFARIAMSASLGSGGVVTFDEAPLAVTSVADPDVSRRVASTVLGSLNSMRVEDKQILLDTFDAWMDAGGSADVAAEQLFCHPNTVRQRLRRLEERTGRSLSNPKELTELCLAAEIDRHLIPEA